MSRFIWKKNQTRRIHTTIRHDHLFELSSHKKMKWGVFVLGSQKNSVFVLYESWQHCMIERGGWRWWKMDWLYIEGKKNPKFYVMNAKTYDANTTTIFDWLCKI